MPDFPSTRMNRVNNESVGQIGAVESVKAASDIVESSITL